MTPWLARDSCATHSSAHPPRHFPARPGARQRGSWDLPSDQVVHRWLRSHLGEADDAAAALVTVLEHQAVVTSLHVFLLPS